MTKLTNDTITDLHAVQVVDTGRGVLEPGEIVSAQDAGGDGHRWHLYKHGAITPFTTVDREDLLLWRREGKLTFGGLE